MDHHNLAGRVICHRDGVRMTIRSQEDLSEIKHQTYLVFFPLTRNIGRILRHDARK